MTLTWLILALQNLSLVRFAFARSSAGQAERIELGSKREWNLSGFQEDLNERGFK